jgi:hypothetical protein
MVKNIWLYWRHMRFILVSVLAVGTGLGLGAMLSASASASYPNPNGPHWHCQEYGHLYAWNCISGYGFTYGNSWAFLTALYQHPHPITDFVDGELYFNQNGPNGMTKTAQWRHRLIAVNDGRAQALVSPVGWRVSDGTRNPPAPVTCMITSGPDMGRQFPCTTADQRSILDAWHQENVVPSQISW